MPEYLITDIRTGRKLRLTGDRPPTEADMMKAFAEGPAQQRPRSLAARAIEDFGALESLGGLAGGLLGGALTGGAGSIPGAMLGAAGMRTIRGVLKGERAEQMALPVLGTAALEALPVVGKGVRTWGRAVMRGALPITEKSARTIGAGSVARGVQQLTNLAEELPGVRLSKMASYIGESPGQTRVGAGRLKELAEARAQAIREARRTPIPSQNILEAGAGVSRAGGPIRERLGSAAPRRGAESVMREFERRVTKTRPITSQEVLAQLKRGVSPEKIDPMMSYIADLSPREADAILRNTKFFSGALAKDLPGADVAARAMRRQLSTELKRAQPSLRPIMAEQAQLIPLQRSVDVARAAGARAGAKAPAAYISGGRPRMFGVIHPTPSVAFGIGKAATKLGKLAGATRASERALPIGVRTLLMRLMAQGGEYE